MRNCRNRKVNRGAILCSRKQGAAYPPATRSRRPIATNATRLFSPACRTHSGPQPASKARNSLSPPLIAIYNAYPTKGRDSTATWNATAVPAASRRTKASETRPFIQGCQEAP
jgi:hypothetical protein